ncbi:MAG: PilZ domain-containing protein [Planctomycetes bacterium]|nr:PilZ domain-containing protein [Planctomycetota bacterium]
MSVDRRKHPRRKLAIRVSWRRIDLPASNSTTGFADDPMERAETVDFSNGGIGFIAAEALPIGAALALQLERDTGGPPLSALGRVARCVEQSDGWLAGIELTWVEATEPEVGLGMQPEKAWTLL